MARSFTRWIPQEEIPADLCGCCEQRTKKNSHMFIECERDSGVPYIACSTWNRIIEGISNKNTN